MQDMVRDGAEKYFAHARKNMPKDKEILELDEYIDLMLKTSYDTQSAAELTDAKERLLAVKKARAEYVSPVFEIFTDYDRESYAGQEMHDRLKEIFARQEEMLFLQNNCTISSSFLNDGFLPHWHANAYFDLIYVYEGTCQCHFRDEKVEMIPGDLLIVPPEIEHGEGIFETGGKVLTTAIRRQDFLELFLRVFSGNQVLHSFFSRILNGDESIRYMLFRTGEDDFIASRFDRVVEEQKTMPAYHNEMCQALIQEIFVHTLRHYETSLVLPPENRTLWKQGYGEILTFISKNYRTVSLEELEERFHYSKRQLIRIIQNLTGQNLAALIREMKLQQAKLLLRETSFSIEKITQECGYDNPSSFSRLFKKEYGMTPGGYRGMQGCEEGNLLYFG